MEDTCIVRYLVIMYLKLEPTAKATHNLMWANLLKNATASTKTSVSTVRMVTRLKPFCTESARCKNSLVSASSREQGDKLLKSEADEEQITSFPIATISFYPVSKRTSCWERNKNNSVLFASTRRKYFQFLSMTCVGATLFLVPRPLFSLVAAFKLSDR